MKLVAKNPFILSVVFFWIGLFVAISFLETPLKFQVSGMTLPIALELGKIMFGISTNIQLGLMVVVFLMLIRKHEKHNKFEFTTFSLIAIILLLEKFWMLPELDARADLLATGKPTPASELHNYFIYAESAKLILLILLGCTQFQRIKETIKIK